MKSNVLPDEIAHFNALKAEWWDATGKMRTLHDINPARMEFIQKSTPIQGKNILDLGCGGGILSESLARAGAIVTGLDLAEDLIQVAREHAEAEKISMNYVCQPIETFAVHHAEEFDVITCMEMLEHVPEPASIIQAAISCLKPSGWIFLSTLNRNLKSYLQSIIAGEYLLRLLPLHTHDYSKFIKPSELREWLQEYGCELSEISGLKYNPLNHQASLSRDPSVNYIVAAKKT